MSKLTGDEYIELLLQRQKEYLDARPPMKFPPLLEWFIRDGDEDLVDLPEPEPKRKPKPRTYRPASYWRDRIASLERRMAAEANKADFGDRAASGGQALGPKRTRKFLERADKALQRYCELARRKAHAESMLRKAELRERKDGGTERRGRALSINSRVPGSTPRRTSTFTRVE